MFGAVKLYEFAIKVFNRVIYYIINTIRANMTRNFDPCSFFLLRHVFYVLIRRQSLLLSCIHSALLTLIHQLSLLFITFMLPQILGRFKQLR